MLSARQEHDVTPTIYQFLTIPPHLQRLVDIEVGPETTSLMETELNCNRKSQLYMTLLGSRTFDSSSEATN